MERPTWLGDPWAQASLESQQPPFDEIKRRGNGLRLRVAFTSAEDVRRVAQNRSANGSPSAQQRPLRCWLGRWSRDNRLRPLCGTDQFCEFAITCPARNATASSSTHTRQYTIQSAMPAKLRISASSPFGIAVWN